jgi:putative cardiolipin synthase
MLVATPAHARDLNRARQIVKAAMVVVLGLVLTACAGSLPEVERPATLAFADTAGTTFGQQAAGLTAAHPGKTGVHLLGSPRRAFATLLGLAAGAERSLDLQYYSWHDDETGWLLLEAVNAAADRGVRVRLLLDDLHTIGLDRALVALDAHPSIEIRLFNPFPARYMRLVDLVRDFTGSNQRMHNKAFIADNQVAVMGGRNIGDGYFGFRSVIDFVDLDLLAVGPLVETVSAQFDDYWNSAYAYPAAAIIDPFVPPGDGYLGRRFTRLHDKPGVAPYLASLDPAILAAPLDALELHWGEARLVVDPPTKIAGDDAEAAARQGIRALVAAIGVPERRLDIVSAYVVMREDWIEVFGGLVDSGVELRILTNSLAGIDVMIAHSGHLARRRQLLLEGVEVWEMKPDAADPYLGEPATGPPGSGGSLHAKAAAIDGERLFVGSLNLDLRSAYLNTEMGVVIDNPELAQALHDVFDQRLAELAYRVTIAEDGSLVWTETTAEGEVRYETEPRVGPLRWFGAGIVALLPIHWLL